MSETSEREAARAQEALDILASGSDPLADSGYGYEHMGDMARDLKPLAEAVIRLEAELAASREREEKLREALRRIEETAQAWCDRDAELGEDSVEWRLAAESRAGLIRNFALAALSEGEG